VNELSADLALRLTSDMLWTAAILAAPLIALTTLVSLVVSIFQVVTQIQEASLTFVPKLIAAVAALLLLGGWMLATLTQFATRMIGGIPSFFG
jgi:flagellar biosynthetic protein FliQ